MPAWRCEGTEGWVVKNVWELLLSKCLHAACLIVVFWTTEVLSSAWKRWFTFVPLQSDAGCTQYTRTSFKFDPGRYLRSAAFKAAVPVGKTRGGSRFCDCWSLIDMMWGCSSKQDRTFQRSRTLTIKQQVKYGFKSSTWWECWSAPSEKWDVFISPGWRSLTLALFVSVFQVSEGHFSVLAKTSKDMCLFKLYHKKWLLWFRASLCFIKLGLHKIHLEAGQRSRGRVRGVSQCNSLLATTPF